MATLDYQSGDDARAQRRDRFPLKLFGSSRLEVWRVLADQIGGRFEEGGLFRGHDGRVIAAVPPWRIVLDHSAIRSEGDTMHHTRMRARYVNVDGFRFTVYRKGIFSALGKLLGMQDVEVGHPRFDDEFVIKGNDEHKLRQLFANDRLRFLIEAQPGIRFKVHGDQLCFEVPELIRDIDRLKLLYDLFAETLHTLCHIGSAYECEPGVNL